MRSRHAWVVHSVSRWGRYKGAVQQAPLAEALCLPVRALARRASERSGLERTETLPVELTGGRWEVGGWGGEAVSVGSGGGWGFEGRV